MCSRSCINFGLKHLSKEVVEGQRILEVGSRNKNGSLRDTLITYNPKLYLGCDITSQDKYVDVVCNVYDLPKLGTFNIVISTEMLEHVKDWRLAINNIKQAIEPTGLLILTTRSRGFKVHGHPRDFWRFEISDMQEIFSDFSQLEIIKDPDGPGSPGVFVAVSKPLDYKQKDLCSIKLFNIITGIIQ